MVSISDHQRRSIEHDCEKVIQNLFYAIDEFDYDSVVDSFTRDGIWHRFGKAVTGHEAIRSELNARSNFQVIRHIATNVIVNVLDADTASAVVYVKTYKHDDGTPAPTPVELRAPMLLGVVSARLSRQADGWRIAEQDLEVSFNFTERQ
ncbi:MAG: nuclear transport factor 2 family protein [Rhizobiaceae bacterium]